MQAVSFGLLLLSFFTRSCKLRNSEIPLIGLSFYISSVVVLKIKENIRKREKCKSV